MGIRRLVGLAVVLAVASGCAAGQHPASNRAVAGLSVAIYTEDTRSASGAVAPGAFEMIIGSEPAPPASPRPGSRALIEDRRWLELASGTHEIILPGIATTVDPSTLLIDSLTDPGGVTMHGCDIGGLLGAGADADTGLGHVIEGQLGREVILRVGELTLRGVVRAVDNGAVTLAGSDGVEQVSLAHIDGVTVPPVDGQAPAGAGVRCTLAVQHAGRQLIQIAYAADAIGFDSDYLLEAKLGVDGNGSALLVSTFTIDNRAGLRGDAAQVSLRAGAMSSEGAPPMLVWSGQIDLRPGTVRVGAGPAAAPLPASLEYVYRGALPDPSSGTMDPYWGGASTSDVWAQLVLGGERAVTMPPGPVMATVTLAGAEAPRRVVARMVERAEVGKEPARIDLWIAEGITGQRHLTQLQTLDRGLIERLDASVANSGREPVVVWVDEPLRRPGQSRLLRKWPTSARVTRELVRFRLEIAPGAIGRTAFDVEYRW